jgi:hypothetical protein
MANDENTGYAAGQGGYEGSPPVRPWPPDPPGKLKKEIEDVYKDAPPGTYCAIEVIVENPITGYRVLGPGG